MKFLNKHWRAFYIAVIVINIPGLVLNWRLGITLFSALVTGIFIGGLMWRGLYEQACLTRAGWKQIASDWKDLYLRKANR